LCAGVTSLGTANISKNSQVMTVHDKLFTEYLHMRAAQESKYQDRRRWPI